jgi:hypothetical protein
MVTDTVSPPISDQASRATITTANSIATFFITPRLLTALFLALKYLTGFVASAEAYFAALHQYIPLRNLSEPYLTYP